MSVRVTALVLLFVLTPVGCGTGSEPAAAPPGEPSSADVAPIVGGTATRHDTGCSYEGRTQFDLNSEVIFTFVNNTEDSNKGFSVWKVPETLTVEEITKARRMPHVVNFEENFYDPYLPTGPGRGPDSVSDVSVVLNRLGLHALICFELIEADENLGQDYPASLITVNE